jgi:hypothetical protein
MFPDGMTVDEREVDVLIQTDSQVKILFDLWSSLQITFRLSSHDLWVVEIKGLTYTDRLLFAFRVGKICMFQ